MMPLTVLIFGHGFVSDISQIPPDRFVTIKYTIHKPTYIPSYIVNPYYLMVYLTSGGFNTSLEIVLSSKANPTSGGVTASTEMLAARRHAGVHSPVIEGKMIIANQQMAYAA